MIELNHNYYSTIPSEMYSGRTDTLPNERYYQFISNYDLRHTLVETLEERTCIIGFACDEGVLRNQGRPGAKEGPNAIRKQFSKLACHQAVRLADLGNINCSDSNLEAAQTQLSKLVEYCHSLNKKTIVLGGGHEVAWPHFEGLLPHYNKIGIINFDAHFDLRPLFDGHKATSGTGFLQMATLCQQKNAPFDYCCIGIQPQANTTQLYQTADDLNVSFMTASEMHDNTIAWQIAFIDEFIFSHSHIYLTLCLDVLSEAFAPGVSAPQPTGITPWQLQPLLKYILQTGKVVALDIAELSPPLDQDDKTVRLAAVLLADMVRYF